jgi:hypothetical protein
MIRPNRQTFLEHREKEVSEMRRDFEMIRSTVFGGARGGISQKLSFTDDLNSNPRVRDSTSQTLILAPMTGDFAELSRVEQGDPAFGRSLMLRFRMRAELRVPFESGSRGTKHLVPMLGSDIADVKLDAVVAMFAISKGFCSTRLKKDTHSSFIVSCAHCVRDYAMKKQCPFDGIGLNVTTRFCRAHFFCGVAREEFFGPRGF